MSSLEQICKGCLPDDCNAFYRHVNNKRLHSLNVLLVYTLQKKTQRHNFSQNLCTKCLKWKKKKKKKYSLRRDIFHIINLLSESAPCISSDTRGRD